MLLSSLNKAYYDAETKSTRWESMWQNEEKNGESKPKFDCNRTGTFCFCACCLMNLLTVAPSLSLSLRLSNNDNRTGVGPFLGEEYNVRSRVAENEKRESARPRMWPRLRVGNVQSDVF